MPTWMPETGNKELANKLDKQLRKEGFKATFGSGNKTGDITYTYENGKQKSYLIARRNGDHEVKRTYAEAHGKGLAKDVQPVGQGSDPGKVISRGSSRQGMPYPPGGEVDYKKDMAKVRASFRSEGQGSDPGKAEARDLVKGKFSLQPTAEQEERSLTIRSGKIQEIIKLTSCSSVEASKALRKADNSVERAVAAINAGKITDAENCAVAPMPKLIPKSKGKDSVTGMTTAEVKAEIKAIRPQISGAAGITLKRENPKRYAELDKRLTDLLGSARLSDVQPVGDEEAWRTCGHCRGKGCPKCNNIGAYKTKVIAAGKDASPFDRDSDVGSVLMVIEAMNKGKTAKQIVADTGFSLSFVLDAGNGKFGKTRASITKAFKEDTAKTGDGVRAIDAVMPVGDAENVKTYEKLHDEVTKKMRAMFLIADRLTEEAQRRMVELQRKQGPDSKESNAAWKVFKTMLPIRNDLKWVPEFVDSRSLPSAEKKFEKLKGIASSAGIR